MLAQSGGSKPPPYTLPSVSIVGQTERAVGCGVYDAPPRSEQTPLPLIRHLLRKRHLPPRGKAL